MDDTPAAPTIWPRFRSSGDAAITVELGEAVDRRTNAKVIRLHRRLHAEPPIGVRETVPAFRSLLVQFDPRVTGPAALQDALTTIIQDVSDQPLPSRRWTIPVCYAPELGLDLAEVAELAGMTAEQVVECHSSTLYYVYMLGFLPGHPYMGDTPAALHLPRRKDPRTRVPRGSLAIATSFTVIYPFDCPGGWNIIARTPVSLFDPAAAEPALLAPGDEVRFEPVTLAMFETLSAAGSGARRA
jgi:KipI family sensor histidine kinase inhibitor